MEVGIMIEVPSAVAIADQLAQEVDFFSIGTNDLTQYLLAVDRNNAQVAELYDSLHPAVLRAIHQVIRDAHAVGRPVSVCGEMAGDPAAALLLMGMGVDSLSMSAASLLRIKWVVRSFTLAQMQELVEEADRLEDGVAVRALLCRSLEDAGLGGLVRAGR
jgi:phosphotransferase system enzyme I (PtsP)